MAPKCCVPNCNSNYERKSENKRIKVDYVPVYRFPANIDKRNQWKSSIPRKDWEVTKNSVVCNKHWPTDAVYETIQGGNKRPKDPPSIFPNIPDSCLPSKLLPRTTVRSSFTIRNVKQDELEHFMKKDIIDYNNLLSQVNWKYGDIIVC